MAIKKGAFDQYAIDRQLPNKNIKPIKNKKHFFEEVTEDNGSQSVHQEQPASVINSNKNDGIYKEEEPNNGSQMDHYRFTKYEVELNDSSNSFNSEALRKSLLNLDFYKKQEIDGADKKLTKIDFSRLVGNQRNLVIALYKNIQMNDFISTSELTLDEISIISNMNKKSLKNTLFRLSDAGYIIRTDQKQGRGGWVKYSLHNSIKEQIVNMGYNLQIKRK